MAKKKADKDKLKSKVSTPIASKKKGKKKGLTKKAVGNKASAKKASSKKAAQKTARKEYPHGKSAEIPYELVYVADSDLHGKGMFARKAIKADITLGLLEGYPTKKDGTYVLWLTEKKGMRVTNDFRFINHDSNPNCALTDTDVITLRKIKPEEELTHDYGW